MPEAKITLIDGVTFSGKSFGAPKNVRGEVVFNTGMSGYVETLTDPSYRGQILVLTYPLQNNYGVPKEPWESKKIQVQGLVVSKYTAWHSHWSAVRGLGDWLKAEGVPAIEGVDTRSLTRHLREYGTIEGTLFVDDGGAVGHESAVVDMSRAAYDAVWPERVDYAGGDKRVLVMDTGIKENIIRSLIKRGLSVIRVPFFYPWESLIGQVDGIVLGNGPGDPKDLLDFTKRLKPLFDRGLPIFGICLGHQLLALAAGGATYKLKYGHRSQNQPVKDLLTGRAYITSQNHGYAVDGRSMSSDWQEWFINLNDGTNEGVKHKRAPIWSVQFHPEAAPGPRDTNFLFDEFLKTLNQNKIVIT